MFQNWAPEGSASEVEIGMENGQAVKENVDIPKETGPLVVVTGKYLACSMCSCVVCKTIVRALGCSR